MRTQSNMKPVLFEIERHTDTAELIFRENVVETEAGYVWDEYRMPVPYRENLAACVESAHTQWLEAAKKREYDALAAQVREKRDKLLADSDARMCLDRMGLSVPTGTTFSAWLSFLRGISGSLTGPWADYRRALRDLPQQPGFPYQVAFPKQPEE